MGLQVQAALFKWLQNLNLAKEGRRTSENKIQLSEQIGMKLYDGVMVGLLIRDITKLHPDQNLFDKIDAIKENSTPAIRLYNWNILTEILKKLGLILEYAQKSKILNMDPQPIHKVLAHLLKLHQEQSKDEEQKPLQVDITEVSKKQQKDANNILQFFVISISKNFKLSPQHTLNLFLDNNKYLAHLLVKGVKNSYDPIFGLFADIQENLDFIVVTLFCVDEEESVKFFFNAIKPALISKDINVSEACLNLFETTYEVYKKNNMSLQNCRKWIKQEGMNTMFFAIKRHPTLIGKIVSLLYLFLEGDFFKILDPVDKSVLWETQTQKIDFFSNLMLNLPHEGVQQFIKTKQFNNWVKVLIKIMKKTKQVNLTNSLIAVLGWMWENIEVEFQSNQNGIPNAFLAFLKACSLHQSDVVFINSIQTMFGLMETLGNRKNNNAPFIYKILVNCFSFSGILSRVNYISTNFKEAFQTIKNLPGGPLVDPLVKSIEKDVNAQAMLLSQILFEENRITEDEIIQLVQVLSSLIFHDVQYGMFALSIIFENISIMNEQMLQEFLQKNGKNALAHFYSVTTSIKRSFKDLKSDQKRYGKELELKKSGSNPFLEQIKKHTILGNLIKFIEKCLEESQIVKENLESVLFYTYIRIKSELKKNQQAELLLPLMKMYYPADDQLQDRINDFEIQINPPKEQEKPTIPEQEQKQEILLGSRSRLKNRSMMNKSLDLSQKPKTPKPLDSSMLKPSLYAVKDLEKLKKKLEDEKQKDEKLEKKKDLIQEKKQLFRSVLNQKRIIEFGAKHVSDMEYKCIFDWDTAREENPNKIHGIPDIKLMNLKYDEEIAYTEDVDSTLKKYRKVWRFLFFKYSSFGAKQKQDFKSQQKINMAEIWKMLKEYDMTILKKEESHAIVRLINQAMKRKNDLQNLTYLGFEEYIFQMCNFGFNKSGYAHVPSGQKIQMMIQQIKTVTENRGGNTDLFQNPEEVYFQQTEVIRQFNRRLKENPEYILPQGYKKIRMVELNYNYEVHPVNIKGFSSSYIDVLEVLDSIFSESKDLGFHLIEPLTHKIQKTLAKPSLFQNINEKMKDYKKGYLLPKQSPPTTADLKVREKASSFKNQFHPLIRFSLGIKLGLAGVNVKNRFIADEVAYWMDDMLDAIQKGENKVENKAQKKIDNDALKKKRASLQKMKFEQKQYEKKWKNRAESVKAKAQADKTLKKQEEKRKKDDRKKARIAEKERQDKQMAKKLQQFKQAKAKLEQKRKQQENRRRQQLQKKKKEKEQYKKSVEEYFMKKKQQLQEKQAAMKKVKQDQKKKQIQEEEKKQDFVKKLHFSILKKEEGVLSKIEELKKGYSDVWTSKQIQDVFVKYEVPLKMLFQLLLKHEKSKISATDSDELSLNTLQFFALKFKIAPFMIEKNTLSKIFQGVGRTSQLHTGVNYNGFKQALFRICVKAKELLNNISQTKKERRERKSTEQAEMSVSPSRVAVMSPRKQSLAEEYLYNTQGVTNETLIQLITFLNLSSDKLGMQERYRQAIETKGSNKPKNMLVKELRSSLQ